MTEDEKKRAKEVANILADMRSPLSVEAAKLIIKLLNLIEKE